MRWLLALLCILCLGCETSTEREMTTREMEKNETLLHRLGVTHITTGTDITVIVQNVRPRNTSFGSGTPRVRDFEFYTDGGDLVIESSSGVRRVPLVESGSLDLYQRDLIHLYEVIRVVLEIRHITEER